jgi:hypothetical protein
VIGPPRSTNGSEVFLSLWQRTRGNLARLPWRIGAFFLGAVLGLGGIFLDISWLVTAALIVLLGGVVLRMLAARDSVSSEQEPRPER